MKRRLCIFLFATTASAWAQTPAPLQATDQVTVTANRSSVPIGETAKTTYTLDAAELHDYPSATLDESLRQHAGLELFGGRARGSRTLRAKGFRCAGWARPQ